MSVCLLAAYHMAKPFSTTTAADRAHIGPAPRSGFTPGARGFVSTCVLGSMGRRGVWIERRRGSVKRNVIGFSAALDSWDSSESDEAEQQSEEPTESDDVGGGTNSDDDTEQEEQLDRWKDPASRTIDGKTIYEVNSYDLRGMYALSSFHSVILMSLPLS